MEPLTTEVLLSRVADTLTITVSLLKPFTHLYGTSLLPVYEIFDDYFKEISEKVSSETGLLSVRLPPAAGGLFEGRYLFFVAMIDVKIASTEMEELEANSKSH